MSRDLKTHRVPVMMTEEEVRAIDEWQHKMRLSSRSEAIRRALQWGLLANVSHHSARNAGLDAAAGACDRRGKQHVADRERYRGDENSESLCLSNALEAYDCANEIRGLKT